MYPENNSSNSQTASLAGMLFNHRRFAPWYDDRADYNTDAKSYYDYLARNNKLMDAIISLINELSNEVENLKPENLQPIKDDIKKLYNLHQSTNLLNRQIAIKQLPTKANDGVSFVQGIQYVPDYNELYVIRKNNELAQDVISRYDFDTLQELDYRVVSTNSASAFTENLTYYIDSNQEINFLIRTNYEQIAFWYNYKQSKKSDDFIIPGLAKIAMDTNKKYIITNFGDAGHQQGAYIYDYQSVVNMKPKMIRQIRFNMPLMYDEKVEGMTIVNDYILLSHGVTQPKTTIVNLYGDVVKTVSHDKQSLVNSILNTYPNANISPDDYEAEGSSVYLLNGKQYPLVTHTFKSSGIFFISRIGDIDGYEINSGEEFKKELTTPYWHHIDTLGDTVTNYSTDEYEQAQFAIDSDGFITLRGVLTYPHRNLDEEWSEMNLLLFTLPFPYYAYTTQEFKTVAGGDPDKTNRVIVSYNHTTSLLEVKLKSTSDNSEKPYLRLDGIRLYTETRGERTPL